MPRKPPSKGIGVTKLATPSFLPRLEARAAESNAAQSMVMAAILAMIFEISHVHHG